LSSGLHQLSVICRPCYAAWSSSFVMDDQEEVCSLSRRAVLQPVSKPLQPGIRLLLHPLHALPSNALCSAPTLCGNNTGLPCSACVTGLG
jgi:hypothetical protein